MYQRDERKSRFVQNARMIITEGSRRFCETSRTKRRNKRLKAQTNTRYLPQVIRVAFQSRLIARWTLKQFHVLSYWHFCVFRFCEIPTVCGEHIAFGAGPNFIWKLLANNALSYFIEFRGREQRKVRVTLGKTNILRRRTRSLRGGKSKDWDIRQDEGEQTRKRPRGRTTRPQLSLIVLPRVMFAVIIYAAYMPLPF